MRISSFCLKPQSRIGVAEWREHIASLGVDQASYLVGVLEDTPGGARYNSAVLFAGDQTAIYRKQRPVPIAEQRPAWRRNFFIPPAPTPARF